MTGARHQSNRKGQVSSVVYLGIDLGTSSVKVLAMDDEGRIIGDVSKTYPVAYPHDKWAEQDPGDWWRETVAAVRELMAQYDIPRDGVRAIGFSGQMHGLVALDDNDEVLLPAILWCDNRTENECAQITQHFGPDGLRDLTGNQCLTGFTAPKILWVKNNRPDIFRRIAHIMLPKDYVRFKLTGDYATDYSDASGFLLLDVENKRWSRPMCDYIGIDEAVLPALYESYDVTGTVSDAAKEELGLTGEIRVVGGAGDNAAGAIGTGTVQEGIVFVTVGTSGVVFAPHQNYTVDKDCRLHAFCHANGKYHSMGVMLSAASCLKWWTDNINKEQDTNGLLLEAADTEPNRKLVFLPYLMGERTPYSDPDAGGVFAGMDMSTTRAQMTRAVLEGVAFGLRDSLEIILDMGIPINEIRLGGGGARSDLWRQIIADIFGRPVSQINTTQGGALGAAILAAVGDGAFPDVETGCRQIVRVVDTVMPDKDNAQAYDVVYSQYQALYQNLAGWFRGAR
jgi:xylulokinase